MTEERSSIIRKWKATNPQIGYNLFEYNYGWNKQAQYGEFIITENKNPVLIFSSAESYFDKRKPNEIQTTD